jgi:hypothetical protein
MSAMYSATVSRRCHGDMLLAGTPVTVTVTCCWQGCHGDMLLAGVSRRHAAGRGVTVTCCWQGCHGDMLLAGVSR